MIKFKLNSTGFKAMNCFNEHQEDIKLGARTLASLVNKDILGLFVLLYFLMKCRFQKCL